MTCVIVHRRRPPLAGLLPPKLCFVASARLLAFARRLFVLGLVHEPGLARALRWSQALSRAGLFTWRQRAERRGP